MAGSPGDPKAPRSWGAPSPWPVPLPHHEPAGTDTLLPVLCFSSHEGDFGTEAQAGRPTTSSQGRSGGDRRVRPLDIGCTGLAPGGRRTSLRPPPRPAAVPSLPRCLVPAASCPLAGPWPHGAPWVPCHTGRCARVTAPGQFEQPGFACQPIGPHQVPPGRFSEPRPTSGRLPDAAALGRAAQPGPSVHVLFVDTTGNTISQTPV